MERLPVTSIARDAVQRYRQNFTDLLRVIALPALAHAMVLYVWYQPPKPERWLVALLWLVQAFLMTLAAISCHRVILLGSESVPRLGASGTATRDWRFIGTAVLLFVVTNVLLQLTFLPIFISLALIEPGLVVAGTDEAHVLASLAALPALYVASRLSMCLPAVAVDRPLGAKQAWRITRGEGLRLLLLISLLPWLLRFAQQWLASAFPTTADYVVAENLLFWLLLPLEIALLSLCYRRLSRPA